MTGVDRADSIVREVADSCGWPSEMKCRAALSFRDLELFDIALARHERRPPACL